MQTVDFKKVWPHVYILAAFALISLLFCFPAIEGQIVYQHDHISWQAMYHQTKTYHDSTGINPLWTNSMFGGMPGYVIGIPENNNYISYLQEIASLWMVKPANFFFLAMVCFYILLNVMRCGRWISAIGALAYSFATYNAVIIAAGHDTKMLSVAYLPAVLAGLILIYRQKWLAGAVLLAISLGLMNSAMHYQMLYYSVILILFYFIGKMLILIKEKGTIKSFMISSVIALTVAAAAVGTIMAPFLTTQEYAKTTERGGESELTINNPDKEKEGGLDKDYAFAWSNEIGETFCLLIPYLYGGASDMPVSYAPKTESLVGSQVASLPLYWGTQPFLSGPVYFGAIVCFLFVLGILVIKNPHKWWMVALCVVTIVMSWGDNLPSLNYWLFDHLPMYNKFRTPTMILTIPQLVFPLLGFWAVAEITRGRLSRDELWKSIKMAAGITGGLCIFFAVFGGAFFDFTNPQTDSQIPPQLLDTLRDDRSTLAAKSSWRSALFIFLAATLFWAFIKEKIQKKVLISGLAILIALDLIPIAATFLNESNYRDPSVYDQAFQPRPVDREILKDPDPYFRVLDLSRNTYNDAIQAYFFKCIGGYSPAKMEMYQDLIDMQLGGSHSGGRFNAEVLNMLNTKYIIFNGPQQQPVYQPNPSAMGNAWFVDNIKWAPTADAEMEALNAAALGDTTIVSDAFEASETAIIRSHYQEELSRYSFAKDSSAYIQLTSYGLNDLEYRSSNSQPGFGVFSEIYYPFGWEAYVDGEPAKIYRVNYVLRALKIPAGEHKITFHFRPKTYEIGNNIVIISNFLLFGLIAGGVYSLVFRKRKGGKVSPVDDVPDL